MGNGDTPNKGNEAPKSGFAAAIESAQEMFQKSVDAAEQAEKSIPDPYDEVPYKPRYAGYQYIPDVGEVPPDQRKKQKQAEKNDTVAAAGQPGKAAKGGAEGAAEADADAGGDDELTQEQIDKIAEEMKEKDVDKEVSEDAEAQELTPEEEAFNAKLVEYFDVLGARADNFDLGDIQVHGGEAGMDGTQTLDLIIKMAKGDTSGWEAMTAMFVLQQSMVGQGRLSSKAYYDKSMANTGLMRSAFMGLSEVADARKKDPNVDAFQVYRNATINEADGTIIGF